MPKSIQLANTIRQLAESSVLADSIVLRMASYSSSITNPSITIVDLTADIATLQAELLKVKSLVTFLQEQQPSTDSLEVVEYTDEQEQTFCSSIKDTLSAMKAIELRSTYTSSLLKTYPKRLRYLVATVLLNESSARNFPSEPFWQELVAKQGAFNE